MTSITLPEIVSTGIYNSQIVFKNKSESPKRKTTVFEIELPLNSGGISYIDDTSHPILENLLICVKPGQTRHTRLPFKCYYIHMTVNEGQLLETLSSLPNFIVLSNTSEIQDIFISLREHYHTGITVDNIMLQSLVMRLIYFLAKYALLHKAENNSKRSHRDAIETTHEYINKNLTAPLTLNNVSKRVNFSPIYFHKLFKASTGMTLCKYVEEKRIKKSIELMLSTEMSLTEIAYECGFSSQSYFSYTFKKKMKLTPREYVKAMVLRYEGSE